MNPVERVILAGDDAVLIPLYERLRAEAGVEVVALGNEDPDSLTSLVALIGKVPYLGETGKGAAPEADLWVCDTRWGKHAGGNRRIDFQEAERRWPKRGTPKPARRGDLRARAEREPAPRPKPQAKTKAKDSSPQDPLGRSGTADFPRELQREILRSKRYHLGFTLTVIRVLDPRDDALAESAFRKEPLNGFPQRSGRVCDTWGLSREGYLLHLAPETLEQATTMRRRLESALHRELKAIEEGEWQVFSGQARFPRDAEQAGDLIALALQRLERKIEINPDGAEDDES